MSPRPDLSAARWRRSSYSNSDGGNCVEVAGGFAGLTPVRDSKRPAGSVLVLPDAAWSAFTGALKAGVLA